MRRFRVLRPDGAIVNEERVYGAYHYSVRGGRSGFVLNIGLHVRAGQTLTSSGLNAFLLVSPPSHSPTTPTGSELFCA